MQQPLTSNEICTGVCGHALGLVMVGFIHVETLVRGRCRKDISDLPLDLAV